MVGTYHLLRPRDRQAKHGLGQHEFSLPFFNDALFEHTARPGQSPSKGMLPGKGLTLFCNHTIPPSTFHNSSSPLLATSLAAFDFILPG